MAFNLTEIQAQQLNPLTPMAFLTPDAGYQANIASYILVGSVSALIWDIFIHVDSDYKLLFRHKIGIPTVIYFLSRVGVLAFDLLYVTFATAQLPSCSAVAQSICVMYHVAFASTALLFFLRVRAVFNQNKFIVAFFAILWLGVLGTSLALVTGVSTAMHFGPTRYCTATRLKPYTGAAPITFAINDTFVFLAISWRLFSNRTLGHGRKSSIKSIILGQYLPAFSRTMFQDGQVYYLVSVTSNIAVAITTWVKGVPISYSQMLMISNVTLTNMMACRVFRNTKFGNIREDTISTRWIASQLGHLDLESGKGHVKSQLHFASFRATENGADDLNGDSNSERALREANNGISGDAGKVADSAQTEKAEL